jgi:hypothetical protein
VFSETLSQRVIGVVEPLFAEAEGDGVLANWYANHLQLETSDFATPFQPSRSKLDLNDLKVVVRDR